MCATAISATMVRPWLACCASTSCGRARNELGDLLAMWLTDNAEAIGVQYLIWDRTSWSVNKRGGTKLYTGSHPHNEHIHVEITEEAGRKETPFFTADDPTVYLPAGRSSAPWPEHDPARGVEPKALFLVAKHDVPASVELVRGC